RLSLQFAVGSGQQLRALQTDGCQLAACALARRSGMRNARRHGSCIAILTMVAAAASAQQYPVKPIRVVIGGSPDAVPRILGQKIDEDWGQQLIVDQRPGAGGTLAAELVAKSSPDGYTLLLCTSGHMMSVNFYKVSYEMVRDFVPVSLIASTSFVLSVHP